MSFFDEAAKALGIDFTSLALGYTIINYNGQAVYIEGVKKIISIAPTEIRFTAGKSTLQICGNNLALKEVFGKCVTVCGKIIYAGIVAEGQQNSNENS